MKRSFLRTVLVFVGLLIALYVPAAALASGTPSALVPHEGETVLVQSITVNCPETIKMGKSAFVEVIVLPTGANQDVDLSSSDESIVEANDNCTLKARSPGTVTITATALDGSGVTGSDTVTVIQPVTSIQLSAERDTLAVGQSMPIAADVQPEEASDKTLAWVSSNPAAASVSDGLVTAHAAGSAIITASACDGSGKSGSLSLTVAPQVTDLSFGASSMKLKVDQTLSPVLRLTPVSASTKTLSWSSSNPEIATVSDGAVTGVAPGSATITVSASADVSASLEVTVVQPVKEILFENPPARLKVGDCVTLTPRVVPENATDKRLRWVSSGAADVADGVVTALEPGTATITATALDGSGVSARIDIEVYQPVTGLRFADASVRLGVRQTVIPRLIVTPEGADTRDLVWRSSDTAIATVAGGAITGVSCGTAVITVSDGAGLSASLPVTVTQLVTDISLNAPHRPLQVGETVSIAAYVQPEDAADKRLNWVSSAPSIASVANGHVSCRAPGSATITATACDGGGASASVEVTVYQLVTGIRFLKDALHIELGETKIPAIEILPENASDKTLTWTSSDTRVASVNQGVITGLTLGHATITAAANDGSGLSASIAVEVMSRGALLLEQARDVTVGISQTVSLFPDAVQADVPKIDYLTWTSDRPSVALVDALGRVTGIAKGSATITGVATDGSGARCSVSVTVVRSGVTGISMAKPQLSLVCGKKMKLKVALVPKKPSDKRILWTSDNPSIASVNEKGVVRALRVGFATITATASSGLQATCVVSVTPLLVKAVKLAPKRAKLAVGETLSLTARISPAAAEEKTLAWQSSDPSIASVDAQGLVTAHRSGQVTITAASTNSKTGTCKLTVK